MHSAREELLSINREILELFRKRQEVVASIQKAKQAKNKPSYDMQREIEVFKAISFKDLSLERALSFSLLMESQVQGDYPKWSQRQHLKSSKGELFEMINPILLKEIRSDLFEALDLENNFKDNF